MGQLAACMTTLKQRFAKQSKTVLPMTWGKPQVPGVVPLMEIKNKSAIGDRGKELLQPSKSTVLQQSTGPSEPPLSDKVSFVGPKFPSDISIPASFIAKQIIPQQLFYFLNPTDPNYGSNVFLITDVEAKRIGIPILRHKIALNTANGASTILGVTPPLLLSYGSKERELLTRHCMLVIKATPSTCFDLLIGNADCAELRAVHDTGFNTLSLYPVIRDPLMYDDPRVVLPVVSATPSTIL
ncbi:hypothetical protein CEUSTIGMA_g2136.t1 [Chlamydomonas eustigma]|uniref:Uncharacterized protein n=1 Tax=Chlamydomonas eustigma TaxID=1157962 RepID=A0A250WV35_9CHLO|nr:hypothetical protein CEUSTIGMA_g2136.t1 [Chlamydomonas eustigma]|eukprot:GAX74688.1 hypothetical protein CEUSTIGMA_g2136.t1 [Chlamydomonas eustigma]